MSIDSTLKREGIRIISQLNNDEVNKIASNIAGIIADAFPEHNINKSHLFISLSRLNMYIAEMPKDMAVAKYFYKNNSIYFSNEINLNDINTLAIHECIHYMQELKNDNGKLIRLGLYNLESTKSTGLALNEAAVQYMASIASGYTLDTVKYYNMNISTVSPDYYPLQTAILNEMVYFTGTYPLFHSTISSNDVFKNTFIAKSDLKTYLQIEKNLDLIMKYESLLSNQIYKLSISSEELRSIKKIKAINSKIDAYKAVILNKTLETQNLILLSCFNNELNLVRSLEDVESFKEKLQNFNSILISTNGYNFFTDFSMDLLQRLEVRKEYIQEYGSIVALESATKELAQVAEHTYGFQFFKTLLQKLELLFRESIREKDPSKQ